MEHSANGSEGSFQSASFVLFFLSGMAGLIYQVLWVRQFTLVLGASTYAVTIVLASFMFGLGAGAWILGRAADRLTTRGLIRAYILIEIILGGYALLIPVLLGHAETAFVGFFHAFHPGPLTAHGFRLVLSFLLLAVPTTLIGGTLPVLSRLVIREKQVISLSVSRLYAVNTFGAILGTLLTGYLLLPQAGVLVTTLIAAGINVVVAFGFWMMGRALAEPGDAVFQEPRKESRKRVPLPGAHKILITGFALSGAAMMFYEIAWTRTLSMIIGTTTYAFTTMLGVILLGIAVGSFLYRLIPETVSRYKLFAGLQLVIAFAVLLTIPGFEKLPFVYLSLHSWGVSSWMDVQFLRFGLAALVMFVPTLAMGMLFPVVSALFVERTQHLGHRLGLAYGLNTTGSMLGACLAGLLLIPMLGMQKTIMAGSLLNISAAILTLSAMGLKPAQRAWSGLAVAGAAAVLLFFIAPWSPRVINSGPYIYADRYHSMQERYDKAATVKADVPDLPSWRIWELAMKQYDLLYYRTGVAASVAVMERDDGVRFLTINGKTDASTGYKSDMRTQVMIGQLPLLFHPDPDKVLIVGLGSGVTAGSVLTHNPRVVDCVEIAPSVVKAAQFFSKENHNALEDERLRIHQRDARNFLLTSELKYDVLVSQPSNPWIRGESSLFSRQFYQLAKERLASGGLLLQWLPTYLMSERDFKVILHTIKSEFEDISMWTSGSVGDVILMARKGGPLKVDYQRFLQKIAAPGVHDDIARLGLNGQLVPFELFVMNNRELNEFLYSDLKQPLPLNTDDRLMTEFETPKRLTGMRKVQHFLDPENLHGDLEAMQEVIFNFHPAILEDLLKQRIDRYDRRNDTKGSSQQETGSI